MVPIYLSEMDVALLLERATVLAIVEDALRRLARGDAIDGPKAGMETGGDGQVSFTGAVFGYLRDRGIVGLKMFATADGNPARGLPRVPATIVICDARTGILQGIVQATSITARRTAALAIAAVRPWIEKRISKAAIVGFGAIGSEIAAYLDEQFDVDEIAAVGRTWEMTRERCEQANLARRTRLVAADTIEAAILGAGLVFTATGLSEDKPVVKGAWIKRGAVVCALGSHQEIDAQVVSDAGCILVDHWQAIQLRGNLAPLVASGQIVRESVLDVADVVAGKIEIEKREGETVLIALIGLGSVDVALASYAVETARERRIGRCLADEKEAGDVPA